MEEEVTIVKVAKTVVAKSTRLAEHIHDGEVIVTEFGIMIVERGGQRTIDVGQEGTSGM